jgi:hypothetical protein
MKECAGALSCEGVADLRTPTLNGLAANKQLQQRTIQPSENKELKS